MQKMSENMHDDKPELNERDLYRTRFTDNAQKRKNDIWKVLCKEFFQKYVKNSDRVLDIGAGYCEFINNIVCAKKVAIDINPDIFKYAASDVEIHHDSCFNMQSQDDSSCDVIFLSNFLEHLKSKENVLSTLKECFRILKKDGRIIILQPNIRLIGGAYWDFFDHYTPLTEKSLQEALEIVNFKILKNISYFLPYTTKSVLPQHPFLVSLYLKFPPIWRILGKQCLLVATPQKF